MALKIKSTYFTQASHPKTEVVLNVELVSDGLGYHAESLHREKFRIEVSGLFSHTQDNIREISEYKPLTIYGSVSRFQQDGYITIKLYRFRDLYNGLAGESLVEEQSFYVSAKEYFEHNYLPLADSLAPSEIVAKPNNGSIQISWKRNDSYDELRLYRKSEEASSWSALLGLSAQAESYIDSSVVDGHLYTYAMQASTQTTYFNSTKIESNTTSLKPYAPSNVQASLQSVGVARITWAKPSGYVSSYKIYKKVDTKDYELIGTQTAPQTSFDDTRAAGKALWYGVVSVIDSGSGAQESSMTTAQNSITALARPDAPIIQKSPGAYHPIDDKTRTITYKWSHTSRDGSGQQAYEIVIVDGQGKKWQSGKQQGSTSSLVIDLDKGLDGLTLTNGTELTFQVRTWGLHADVSPYSEPKKTTFVYAPKIVVKKPVEQNQIMKSVPIELSFDLGGRTISYANIIVVNSAGEMVYEVESNELTFDVNTIIPPNNDTYTAYMVVRDGYGLEAAVETSFTTKYLEPALPQASVAYDLDRFVTELFVSFGKGSQEKTEYLSVSRVDQNGTTLLASHLLDKTSVVDKYPPLNVDFTYQVIAFSKTGAVKVLEVPARVHTPGVSVINFGDTHQKLAKLSANLAHGYDTELEQEVVQYVGRKLPVLYSGKSVLTKIPLRGDVFQLEDIKAWKELSEFAGRCVYRDCWGYRANVSVKVTSDEAPGFRVEQISADLVVIE